MKSCKKLFFVLLVAAFYPIRTEGQEMFATASDLYEKAQCCFVRKSYDSAIAYYHRFLVLTGNDGYARVHPEIMVKPGFSVQRARAFLKLAASLDFCEKYDSALAALFEGLDECHQRNSRASAVEAQFYLQIGSGFLMKRDYPQALDWFRKCIAITGGKGKTGADAYQNIGAVCFIRMDYENAILNYQKAWIGYRSLAGKDPVQLFRILTSLGTAYTENNEPSKGLTSLRYAVNILRTIEPADSCAFACLYLDIASSYLRMNKPESAFTWYMNALASTGGDDTTLCKERIIALKGLAGSCMRMNRLDSSLFYLNRALHEIHRFDGQGLRDEADICIMFGDIFRVCGDYQGAEFYFQEALSKIFLVKGGVAGQSFEVVPKTEPGLLFRILERNANLLLLESGLNANDTLSLRRAYDLYRQAIHLAEFIGRELESAGSKILFYDSVKDAYSGAVEASWRLWVKGKKDFGGEILRLTEAERNRVLEYEIRERQMILEFGFPDSLLLKRFRFSHDQDLDANAYRTLATGTIYQQSTRMENRLVEDISFRIENDSVNKWIRGALPAPTGTNYSPEISYPGITARVPAGEIVLDYYRTDSSIFCLAFTSDTFQIARIPLRKEFTTAISDYQKSIKRNNSIGISFLGKELYRALLQPVENLLGGKTRMIIIPDEELAAIPFEALINGDSTKCFGDDSSMVHYLIRDYEIAYHFSIQTYLDARKRLSPHGYTFLGIAPVFRKWNDREISLDPLSASASEVSSICTMFRKNSHTATCLTDTDATKSVFFTVAGKFTHLHFATHTIFRFDKPDLPELALAPDPHLACPGGSSLEIKEIERMNLMADLVVLGTCSSGKGSLSRSEGMLAFPRSFYVAGAGNILYTLWNVPDLQTRDFMVDFYRNFLHGETYSSALRTAKLKMIANSETSLPYLWAGFELIGK